MCEPTILVVDNREDLLASTRDYLEPHGYVVLIAKNGQEAIDYCRTEVVHLAVIDVRLINDQDQDDWSGLHLADEIDPSISKIILTGHRFDDTYALVRRVLGPDDRGQVLAADFVLKREGPGKLLEAIRSAFQNRIRLNTNLKTTMSKALTWRTLVDQLNLFRERDEEEKLKAEKVMEYLTCRLFFDANAVYFLRTTPGYGACTVALVRPSFNGASGTELAVKFGPRQSISQEVDNYRQWVNPFAGIRSTQLQEGPVWSREMGAIAYKFVGENVESISDFRAYYNAPETSDRDVITTLENLFQTSCKKWYESTRHPIEPERKRLDLWYREQLNLLDAAAIAKLQRAFNSLLEGQNSRHGKFRILDDGSLQVRLSERPPLTLPNPIQVALVGLHDVSSERAANLFPLPSKVAITHGDLHASNVLVGKSRGTWLIDFYRTGWGPALRDFAEMESDIKFDLIGDGSLRARYDLELALLSPKTLNERIAPPPNTSPKHIRGLAAIQRLRELASLLTDTESAHEYYVGLLFYALKRIIGFTSSSEEDLDDSVARHHALLSAAMICQHLVAQRAKGEESHSEEQVFISYARADTEKVNDLYRRLSEQNFKPWMDTANILPGEDWEVAIQKAIRQSRFFIACLSMTSVDRRGVIQKEIKQALDIWQEEQALDIWREQLDSDIYLIPVRFDDCVVPNSLSRFQRADLFAEAGWVRLMDAIREGIKRRKTRK